MTQENITTQLANAGLQSGRPRLLERARYLLGLVFIAAVMSVAVAVFTSLIVKQL